MSSWSGNVTVQGSRQHTESTPEPGLPASVFPSTQTQSLSYSINLTYEHHRALGVRNLRFYALATANSQQVESWLAGDVNAPPEFINNSLELRFDYFIGRVLARLSARTAEIGGRRQSQVLFRITRYFGSM